MRQQQIHDGAQSIKELKSWQTFIVAVSWDSKIIIKPWDKYMRQQMAIKNIRKTCVTALINDT